LAIQLKAFPIIKAPFKIGGVLDFIKRDKEGKKLLYPTRIPTAFE